MKIRISGNSIRFRLKQPEVIQFKNTGNIIETIEFGPLQEDKISFSLVSSAPGPLSIEMVNNNVRILLPDSLVNEWVDTDMVGIEKKVESKGRTISVLIEKDFACLDGDPKENEGSFPNPLANCKQ
jgi:hypothetical protein